MAFVLEEALPKYQQLLTTATTLDGVAEVSEQILDDLIGSTRSHLRGTLSMDQEPPEVTTLLDSLSRDIWKRIHEIVVTMKPTEQVGVRTLEQLGIQVSYSDTTYVLPDTRGVAPTDSEASRPPHEQTPVHVVHILDTIINRGIHPENIMLDIGRPGGTGWAKRTYARLRANGMPKELLIPMEGEGAIYIGDPGDFQQGHPSKEWKKKNHPYVVRFTDDWLATLALAVFTPRESIDKFHEDMRRLGAGIFLQAATWYYKKWPEVDITIGGRHVPLSSAIWLIQGGKDEHISFTRNPAWNTPDRRRFLAYLYGETSKEVEIFDALQALHALKEQDMANKVKEHYPDALSFMHDAGQTGFDFAKITCTRADDVEWNRILHQILDTARGPRMGIRKLGSKLKGETRGAAPDTPAYAAKAIYGDSNATRRSDAYLVQQSINTWETVKGALPNAFFDENGHVDSTKVRLFLSSPIAVNDSPFGSEQEPMSHLSYAWLHNKATNRRCSGKKFLTPSDKTTILGIWGVNPNADQ